MSDHVALHGVLRHPHGLLYREVGVVPRNALRAVEEESPHSLGLEPKLAAAANAVTVACGGIRGALIPSFFPSTTTSSPFPLSSRWTVMMLGRLVAFGGVKAGFEGHFSVITGRPQGQGGARAPGAAASPAHA